MRKHCHIITCNVAFGYFNLEVTVMWYLIFEKLVLIMCSILYYLVKHIAVLHLDYAFVKLYVESSISQLYKITLGFHQRYKLFLTNLIKIGQAQAFKILIGSATWF